MAILTELPRFETNDAATILDVIGVWTERGYAGNRIQDAFEHLWNLRFICTDDDETPPIYPRCSVLFSSPGGDAFVGHRAQQISTIPERFVEGLQRLKAARGLKNKDLAASIGVSEAYVSNMMRGKRDVKLTMLDRLRTTKLGVTVLDMFGPEPDQGRRKRE
ncbi:helix-turn-helix domain-containing protein [Agrobacterium fabrum]|uniref:helix-turn-helix domain-containing protein n=1 Tax=Agrobacterium fabrum TaxID=1176649 RepID=UPI0021585343|nr:helix-turn-helix transcriptional regulator [Agrobacterium fabrum]MCR6727717.1 helix-turn-helix domain-containing protein [Agrobacterium fabrum]